MKLNFSSLRSLLVVVIRLALESSELREKSSWWRRELKIYSKPRLFYIFFECLPYSSPDYNVHLDTLLVSVFWVNSRINGTIFHLERKTCRRIWVFQWEHALRLLQTLPKLDLSRCSIFSCRPSFLARSKVTQPLSPFSLPSRWRTQTTQPLKTLVNVATNECYSVFENFSLNFSAR